MARQAARSRHGLITLTGTLMLSATLATGALAAEPKRGGILTYAMNADVRGTEPGNRDGNTDLLIHHLFEGLVAYRADMTVGPALAERWTVEDDGKTYRFTLRDGVTFHNGAPLTSAEVKWSWDFLAQRKDWGCQRYLLNPQGTNVVAVETPDPQTVVYRLQAPSGLFLTQMANIQCNTVVMHPDSVDGEGKWAKPIGTGPFKLNEWRRTQHVLLDRYDGYRVSAEPASGYAGARKVNVDQVKFQVIADPSVALAALRTGAIDVITRISPHDIAPLEKDGMRVQSTQGLQWDVLLLQDQDPVLANVKVRQAIAHALDLEQIARARTEGLTGGSPSAVDPTSSYYDKQFAEWPAYDPARARALLKEAGYKGEVLKLQTAQRQGGTYETSVLVQAMLQAAGINAQLDVLEWGTQFNAYMSGKFQMQGFSYSARFDPSLRFGSLIGDKTKTPYSQWSDPKAIALLDESIVSSDPARRKEIFAELHRMMREQVPAIGLYYRPIIQAVHPRVHDYAVWAADLPISWGVWKE